MCYTHLHFFSHSSGFPTLMLPAEGSAVGFCSGSSHGLYTSVCLSVSPMLGEAPFGYRHCEPRFIGEGVGIQKGQPLEVTQGG